MLRLLKHQLFFNFNNRIVIVRLSFLLRSFVSQSPRFLHMKNICEESEGSCIAEMIIMYHKLGRPKRPKLLLITNPSTMLYPFFTNRAKNILQNAIPTQPLLSALACSAMAPYAPLIILASGLITF